jgi:hypothetical protein
MQEFTLLQCAKQRFAGFRLFGQLWDLVNELIKHRIPIGACQIQVHSRRRKQFGDR